MKTEKKLKKWFKKRNRQKFIAGMAHFQKVFKNDKKN